MSGPSFTWDLSPKIRCGYGRGSGASTAGKTMQSRFRFSSGLSGRDFELDTRLSASLTAGRIQSLSKFSAVGRKAYFALYEVNECILTMPVFKIGRVG